jgi:hypothetical protein
MRAAAALQRKKFAYTLVRKVRSNSSAEISSSDLCVIWKAALFTSTSSRPKASKAWSTSLRQCASSQMSPGTATQRRPARSIHSRVTLASSSSSAR